MPYIDLKNLESDEGLSAEIRKIENAAQERLSNDSDPLDYLEKCLAEIYSINPKLMAEILAIKLRVEQQIKNKLDEKPISPVIESKPKEDNAKSDDRVSDRKSAQIKEINSAQKIGIGSLLVLTTSGAKTFDENGEELSENVAKSKERKGKITQTTKENEAQSNSFVSTLGEIYQKFAGLGFKVKTSKQEIIDEATQEQNQAQYFAIALPKKYKGNRDPLTMGEEQIQNLTRILEEDPNQEMEVFSEVIGSMAKEFLKDFYVQENRSFVKELMSERGTPSAAILGGMNVGALASTSVFNFINL